MANTWGPWSHKESNNTLQYEGSGGYEIDLDECTTGAVALDIIVQISEKQWADAATLGALVKALNEVLPGGLRGLS